jgi:hypothetical protein
MILMRKESEVLSLSLAWLGLGTRVLTKHVCIHEKEFIPLRISFQKSSVDGAQSSKKVISRIVLLAAATFDNEHGREMKSNSWYP